MPVWVKPLLLGHCHTQLKPYPNNADPLESAWLSPTLISAQWRHKGQCEQQPSWDSGRLLREGDIWLELRPPNRRRKTLGDTGKRRDNSFTSSQQFRAYTQVPEECRKGCGGIPEKQNAYSS